MRTRDLLYGVLILWNLLANPHTAASQSAAFVETDDLYTLRVHTNLFVDKSLVLRDLLEDEYSDVVQIVRPKGWGKSVIMKMLRIFLQIEVDTNGTRLPQPKLLNDKLFIGGEVNAAATKQLHSLKIAADRKIMIYQGKFPLIFLTLADIKGESYEEIEYMIRVRVVQLVRSYWYLRKYTSETSDALKPEQKEELSKYFQEQIHEIDFLNSIRFLSQVLYVHFKRTIFILIDAYDTPVYNAHIKFSDKKPDQFKRVVHLVGKLLANGLKDNPNLRKGFITGVLRVAFHDLDSVLQATLLSEKRSNFTGFTSAEVDELLARVQTRTDPNLIKDWYTGYNIGGQVYYNPYSIIQCLVRDGKPGHYWQDGGINELLAKKKWLTEMAKEDLLLLLKGGSIIREVRSYGYVERIDDNVINLLVFAGYLNAMELDARPDHFRYHLMIPNREVRCVYTWTLVETMTKILRVGTGHYKRLIHLLLIGRIEHFGKKLQMFFMKWVSFHDVIQEEENYNLMDKIVLSFALNFTVESVGQSNYGGPVHVLIPLAGQGNKAVILEYRRSNKRKEINSEDILSYMKAQPYYPRISEYAHVKKIIIISLEFFGKDVVADYQINNVV